MHRRPERDRARARRSRSSSARAARARARPRALARRAARVPPGRRRGLTARGNPAARDLVRHALGERRRQRQPRALVGARGAPLADGRAARPARRLPPDRRPDAAAVGRRGPAAPAGDRRGGARPAARRAAARARRAPASCWPTTTPSGVARELARVLRLTPGYSLRRVPCTSCERPDTLLDRPGDGDPRRALDDADHARGVLRRAALLRHAAQPRHRAQHPLHPPADAGRAPASSSAAATRRSRSASSTASRAPAATSIRP